MEVVAGTTREITKHKRIESALRESEQHLRNLAESLESQIQTRTAELEQRNADVLCASQELRDLSARLMHTQDQERRHFARELHDSAGQTLAVLGLNFAQPAQGVKRHLQQLAKLADESEALIQQLNREIRTTSYLLHPPLLDEAGLASAISGYVRGLVERGTLNVTVDVSDNFGRLPGTLELVLFRIVQECLTNVIRHSGSDRAEIRIRSEAGVANLEVHDFGKGISAEKLAEIREHGSGVGIRGMPERVRQGDMHIESSDTGTTVRVTLPLPAEARSSAATSSGA
jgi:signal transduction histidine kinase